MKPVATIRFSAVPLALLLAACADSEPTTEGVHAAEEPPPSDTAPYGTREVPAGTEEVSADEASPDEASADSSESSADAGEAPADADSGVPYGSTEDLARAEALWDELGDYRTWSPFPGLEGWQPGESPHGAYLKYFVDDAVAADPSAPVGDGAVIVKENYTRESADALVAVTVMQKIQGYAPEHGDWFWVKYGPSGDVLANEDGVPLAGRIAAGSDEGCIACHASADGGDYLFAND